MTITRELQSATIKGYSSLQADDYGQLVPEASRNIEVMVKVYSQTNVQDPRYVDVELVGFTKDDVVPGEVISLAQGDYRIKYVVPTARWHELMLTKL